MLCKCEGYQVECFVSVLLFIGVGSEKEAEGMCVERKDSVMG
jgi:hypothetical protein